jgi:ketosteroid isomerase-like protein
VEHPNREISRLATDALVSRDLRALAGFLSDDVVVHVGGRGPFSGDHVGVSAVTDLVRRHDELLDAPAVIQPHDVLADQDHAAVLLGVRVRRNGRAVETQMTVVAHLRDGRIGEAWVQCFDQVALDDLYTPE